MSIRNSNWYHISTNAKHIMTLDECIMLANKLKITIERFCKKVNGSCMAYIGISVNNKKYGEIKVGYRGLKKFITSSHSKRRFVNPHLHIYILANPGETIAKELCRYLTKNCDGRQSWHKNANEYKEKCVRYSIIQSLHFRTATCNIEQLPKEDVDYLCKLSEVYNVRQGGLKPVFQGVSDKYYNEFKERNDLFTDYLEETEAEILIETKDTNTYKNSQELQYNNIFTTSNNMLYEPGYQYIYISPLTKYNYILDSKICVNIRLPDMPVINSS